MSKQTSINVEVDFRFRRFVLSTFSPSKLLRFPQPVPTFSYYTKTHTHTCRIIQTFSWIALCLLLVLRCWPHSSFVRYTLIFIFLFFSLFAIEFLSPLGCYKIVFPVFVLMTYTNKSNIQLSEHEADLRRFVGSAFHTSLPSASARRLHHPPSSNSLVSGRTVNRFVGSKCWLAAVPVCVCLCFRLCDCVCCVVSASVNNIQIHLSGRTQPPVFACMWHLGGVTANHCLRSALLLLLLILISLIPACTSSQSKHSHTSSSTSHLLSPSHSP